MDYRPDGHRFLLLVRNLTRCFESIFLSVQSLSNPNLGLLSSSTQQQIFAFIYFTNLDSCTNSSTMPDQINYILRMQEYGQFTYHAQSAKIDENDYLWKTSPEDFCQGIHRLYSDIIDLLFRYEYHNQLYWTISRCSILHRFVHHTICDKYRSGSFQCKSLFYDTLRILIALFCIDISQSFRLSGILFRSIPFDLCIFYPDIDLLYLHYTIYFEYWLHR